MLFLDLALRVEPQAGSFAQTFVKYNETSGRRNWKIIPTYGRWKKWTLELAVELLTSYYEEMMTYKQGPLALP